MTTDEFLNWLTYNCDCEIKPAEGFNTTGVAVKIVNPATKYGGQKPRYHYFQGPFGNKQIPSKVIRDICEKLWIGTYPPGITTEL